MKKPQFSKQQQLSWKNLRTEKERSHSDYWRLQETSQPRSINSNTKGRTTVNKLPKNKVGRLDISRQICSMNKALSVSDVDGLLVLASNVIAERLALGFPVHLQNVGTLSANYRAPTTKNEKSIATAAARFQGTFDPAPYIKTCWEEAAKRKAEGNPSPFDQQ